MLLGLLPGLVQAATLVVDQKAVHAADTNPGTRARPFKTISAAAKRVKPGDIVLVRPGVYRESVSLTVSGVKGRPITFQSETPYAAVVDGADIITAFQPVSPGVYSFAAPDLAKPANDFDPGEQVYVNSEPLERVTDPSHLSPGTFLLDYAARRVLLAPLEDQRIERVQVAYAHRDGQFAPGASVDDIHIKGFTILHNASPFGSRFGILISGRRWRVEDNHILWSSYAGLRMEKSKDCVVRNNVVDWSGATGLGGFANANLTFTGNVLRHGNWRRQDTGFDGGAGKWVYTYDSLFQDNECAFNNGFGLWFDIACGDNVYQGNITHDSAQNAGLFTEISWNTQYLGNIAFNNDQGLMVGESSGCLLKHNVCFNNGTGLYMRGDDRRLTATEYGYQSVDSFRKLLADNIPGLDPARLDTISREYNTYWIVPKAHQVKDNTITQNLFLDNNRGYYEWRNYGKPSAVDADIANASDDNLFYGTPQDALFTYSDGAYPSLDAWRKASGRDGRTVVADPRDPSTPPPAWASASRPLWAKKMRSWDEITGLNLGLVKTPSAAELNGRLMRSPDIQPFDMGDPEIKAYLLSVGGQRTLAFWTTQVAARRPVRVRTGSAQVVVEDGYLRAAPTRGAAVSLMAGFLPTYVRGVGPQVAALPATAVTVTGFSLPGQPVIATAHFLNDGRTPQSVTADFQAPSGYSAAPAHLSHILRPGERYEPVVTLTPQGEAVHGAAQVRMEAQLDGETVTRVAAFTVGEGAGAIPFTAAPPALGAGPEAWEALGRTALIGTIASPDQFATGDKSAWKGPLDLSAKIYAAWTPDALLVGVDVTDDAVVPAPPGAAPWDSDAVEVCIDGRGAAFQYQKEPTEGVYQIGISPADPPVVRVLSKSPVAGLQTASRRTPGGYFISLRVPLTAQNFPAGDLRAGRPLKMSVLLDDKDDPQAARKNVFGWHGSPNGANYADTSGWKTVILTGKRG